MSEIITLGDRRPYTPPPAPSQTGDASDEAFWSTRQELRACIEYQLALNAAWPESATLAELKRKVQVIGAGLDSIRDDISRLMGEARP